MSTIPRDLGKYELQHLLGRGSAGEVWKGYNTQSHSDVAIKLIHSDLQSDPHFLTRFTRAGELLTSLQHANIVRVREATISRPPQTSETTAYLVMDYIEGQTLADYIATTSHKGSFPPADQIVYLFTSIGVAIDYAHQRGIVHGNIKPGNILLDRHNTHHFSEGEPLLVDTGLAQLLGSAAGISSTHYMSPEQARGNEVNNRSDIYALGVILYEICTGVQPFRDESSVAVMMQHINTLPTPPNLINPNIPHALSEVILRAMSKDAGSRFSMASLLAAAIADACSIQPMLELPRGMGNEEEELPRASTNSGSLLGVSQPSQKLFARRQPNSQPLPRISRPLTGTTGKQPTIRPNPLASAPRIIVPTPSEKMPVISGLKPGTGSVPTAPQMNKMATPTPSAKVPVPHQPPRTPATIQLPVAPASPARVKASGMRQSETPIYIAFAALALLLIVIGSAIGANVLLQKNQRAAPIHQVMSGHIFFQDDTFGHDDQVHIEMQNVPAPAGKQNYFAWLQTTNKRVVALGRLPWRNGSISYTYPGNNQHSNLLPITQGFSITSETSNPQAPSGRKIYQANFDNATLPYVKNILYSTPGLPGKQSVVAELLETIKSMNDKADSIYDSLLIRPDDPLVKRQATRIIEMIDSTRYAVSKHDLPDMYHPLQNAQVGLLSSPTQQGYLDTLATQLAKLKQTANGNEALLQRIQNIENAITNLQTWVQKIRTFDVQVLKAANLKDPGIIGVALQLKNTAADSYVGRTIPPNPAPLPTLGSAGAAQAYTEAQYLAMLDVKPV
jgi:serine/threonine protein kinase